MGLVTARDAAKLYRKKLNHIYRLANYYGWRRIKHQGRVYYDLEQVDSVLGKDPGDLR